MLDDLGRSQGSVINSNLIDLAFEGGLLVVSAAENDGGESKVRARRAITVDLGLIVSIKMNDNPLAVAGENNVVPGAGIDRRPSREDFSSEALRNEQASRRPQPRRSVQAERIAPLTIRGSSQEIPRDRAHVVRQPIPEPELDAVRFRGDLDS